MSIHRNFPSGVVPRNLFEERSDISLNGVTRNDMLNSLRHMPGGTASLLVTLGIVPRFPLEESQFMKERTIKGNLRGLYEQLNKNRLRTGLAPFFTEDLDEVGPGKFHSEYYPAPDALSSSTKVREALDEFIGTCSDDYLRMLCQTELFYRSNGDVLKGAFNLPSMDRFSDMDIYYLGGNSFPMIQFRFHDESGQEKSLFDAGTIVCTLVIPSWNPYEEKDWWDGNIISSGHHEDFFVQIYDNGAVSLHNRRFRLDEGQYDIAKMFGYANFGIELPRYQCYDFSCYKSVGTPVYFVKPLFERFVSDYLTNREGVPCLSFSGVSATDQIIKVVPKEKFLEDCMGRFPNRSEKRLIKDQNKLDQIKF